MAQVTLPYEELILASTAAAMTQSKAIREGAVGYDHGQHTERHISRQIADHILGEIGEQAVARKIDRHQTRGTELREIGDLGDEDEVKATEYADGHLLLHEDSPEEARFFLAIVSFGRQIRVELPGWIWGREGKLDRYWGDRSSQKQPCYWVPQSALRPFDQLNLDT
jgi:hypothetical protein